MKYKICVSGAAVNICGKEAEKKALELGKEIARQGQVLVNGATTGLPAVAAKGAKRAGGTCIGFSPAMNPLEHTKKYRLPTEDLDLIVYTGFGYSGRNLFLIRSSDAVVFVCGRIGTLNEFTSAFEDKKPIGILLGSGGTTEYFDDVIRTAKRGNGFVVYDSDPKTLIKRLMALAREMQKNHNNKKGKRAKGG